MYWIAVYKINAINTHVKNIKTIFKTRWQNSVAWLSKKVQIQIRTNMSVAYRLSLMPYITANISIQTQNAKQMAKNNK